MIVVSKIHVGDVWAGHLLAVEVVTMLMYLARGSPNFPIHLGELRLVEVVAVVRLQYWMVLLLHLLLNHGETMQLLHVCDVVQSLVGRR